MLRENDLENLNDLADQIISRTEKSMREEIEKIPDGIYRAEGIIEQMKGQQDVVIKAAVRSKRKRYHCGPEWILSSSELGW